jgi:hypothetical protein
MPFKSQAQRAYMYANHPQLAKEFEEATPKGASLPEHVAKMAYGGETNPMHETVKSMENNPTAGFADGGDVPFNYKETYSSPTGKGPNFLDDPKNEDSILPYLSDPTVEGTRDNLEPGIMGDTTPREMNSLKALNDIGQGFFAGKMGTGLAEGMNGLGEGGFARLGNAPKMETPLTGPDGITVFEKGVQKGINGAKQTLWGVKGTPEALMKHFNDPAPATVPEHILRAKGFLPADVKMIPKSAPNNYADGGEVKRDDNDEMQGVKAPHAPTEPDVETSTPTWNINMGVHPKNMADGGDPSQNPFQQALQQIATPFKPLMYPAQMAQGIASSPMVQQSAQDIAASALGTSPAQPMRPPTPPTGPQTDPGFMNQLNQGMNTNPNQVQSTPQQPSLSQASHTAHNAPPTDYNFYKNMTAEDRNALYQKLTQQQHSGGNLAASAIGGLGDAISNAFGHGGQHTQQDIMNRAEASKQGQIGAMDTERTQKMQDVQAKMTAMEGDPNSAYSQGMRQFYKQLMGVNAPSNMSAGMLKGMLPDLAKVFEAKTTAATQGGAQGIEAAKAQIGETWGEELKKLFGLGDTEGAENYLKQRTNGATPSATSMHMTSPSGIKYGVR